MKRNLIAIVLLAMASMIFAEKKVFYSNDGTSLGGIEVATDGEKNLVMFQNVSVLYANTYVNYSLFYKFDSYSKASTYYQEQLQKIKEDNYDSFWELFKTIRDSEDFASVSGNIFTNGNTLYTVKTVNYKEKKNPEPSAAKNTDTDYLTVTIKEINANETKYDGKIVCIQNIKLWGDDPIDNNGNIPAVVYANNQELITVKITVN